MDISTEFQEKLIELSAREIKERTPGLTQQYLSVFMLNELELEMDFDLYTGGEPLGE